MSDVSQGPGWWQASDGHWYPPEQAPGYQPPQQQPAQAATPPPGYVAPQPAPQPQQPAQQGWGGPQPGYAAPYGGPPGGQPPQFPYQQPASGIPAQFGQRQLATWGQRVIARLIDGAIVMVIYIPLFIIAMILSAAGDAGSAIGVILMYTVAFAAAIYFSSLNGSCGQSPGKALTGLIVVSENDGQFIGGGMGIVREFAHIIDTIICYIGWIFPLWDVKKQTIGDKIMHTLVFTDGPKRNIGEAIRPPKS